MTDDEGSATADRRSAADDRSVEDEEPSHSVTLRWRDGREETIRVRNDETVFGAAEREGVGLPVGCRTGACGTCTARRCEDGDGVDSDAAPTAIEHVRPPRALKQRHLADGYVLACIARPLADCTLAVGTDVHAELVENPWR